MKPSQSNPNRSPTPAYLLFYLLFSPDTWRVLIGILASLAITPRIRPTDLALAGQIVLFVMLAVIGYTLASRPGRWIAGALQRLITGNRRK